MRYRKSLEIEKRLANALQLIRTGRYSTPLLADALGVSVPTVSRIVAALRERGHDIKAERRTEGWRYTVTRKTAAKQSKAAGRARKSPGS